MEGTSNTEPQIQITPPSEETKKEDVAAKPKPKPTTRKKVFLGPGFSHLDWMKLVSSGRDLAGTGGRVIRVSREEVGALFSFCSVCFLFVCLLLLF